MAITSPRHTQHGQKRSADRDSQLGRFVKKPLVNHANIVWHQAVVGESVREAMMRQRPVTLWLTGLSGAGKSCIAYALEKMLLESGHCCAVLDGDNVRHHLNSDLGFSAEDRHENIRRAAEVAHLMNEAGLIVLAAFISPLERDRAMASDIISEERFIEVHVNTSSAICEGRDPKGLYARARKGEIAEFTGISAPYQAPSNPSVTIDTEAISEIAAAQMLFDILSENSVIR